jgi:hypothetical protein
MQSSSFSSSVFPSAWSDLISKKMSIQKICLKYWSLPTRIAEHSDWYLRYYLSYYRVNIIEIFLLLWIFTAQHCLVSNVDTDPAFHQETDPI